MSTELTEKIAYNSLAVTYGGDYVKLRKFIENYGSWAKALSASQELFPKTSAQNEWAKLEKEGVELIMQSDLQYPQSLKEIAQPPHGLYIKGKLSNNNLPHIAIVGTRRCTSNGKSIAYKFGQEISKANAIIVSGLALGIDTAAHEGALASEAITLAVLAGGLDNIYPPQNKKLALKIIETGGALISEYPLFSRMYLGRFLARNRIVSGLSRGVLLVEAPQKSGALSTAKFAIEQNRNVYVVPGPINHPNYKGSHGLIKEGAGLVTEPSDILKDLGLISENEKSSVEDAIKNLNDAEKKIYNILKLSSEPLNIDKIIEIGKLEPYTTMSTLTFLGMKGIIKESFGFYELS
jgi:DNA processing protein